MKREPLKQNQAGRWLRRCLFAALALAGTASLWAAEATSLNLQGAEEVALASPQPEMFAPPEDDSAQSDWWDLKGQVTYIYQRKQGFHADYTLPGYNSLSPQAARSYSLSATAYLGVRLWKGAEFYYNEEMVLGVPFSDLTGLAGVPNAELQKASGPNPLFYRPRMFVRQTLNFGGESEAVDAGLNQLATSREKRRLVLTLGNFSIVDIFDNNAFAHDGRRDFLNWTIVSHGAFDYAADVRGYTWGGALEYYHDDWAFRIGRFVVPQESNGLQLDHDIMKFHGDQLEIEHAHEIAGQPGKLRFLAFRNVEMMGKFRDALNYAAANGGGAPDVGNVRRSNVKYGYGLNLEQNITDDVGVFARASWNNGTTEMFSYTEVERSIQAGTSIKGSAWGRAQDTVGVAFVQNGLSKDHRDYLAAGGVGFLIGDGKLNYRPERIAETYYSVGVTKNSWLTFDYQHISNPAYNADRGAVNIWGIRLHTEI